MIKNKRGDIPITILVVGILAICLLAIFSFYFSDGNVKKDFAVVGAVEEAKLLKERIDFHGELGFDNEELKELFDIQHDDAQAINFINITRGKISVRYNLPN
ncbi:MAG TPA: hypothetical protein ENI22_00330 [Candidatus Pacearchaeota archaeon]|nr:hypothetical protein [Candidatus Pacearchaeota archaeon]